MNNQEIFYNMKIAVTSTDGKYVDTHFGHAHQFYIYTANCKGLKFIEVRESSAYCFTNDTHNFQDNRLDLVFSVIQDCDLLFTKKIGEVPCAKLEEKGIKVLQYRGLISEINS